MGRYLDIVLYTAGGGQWGGEKDARRFRWRCNRGRGGWSYTAGTPGGAAVGESEAASVVEALVC